MTELSVIIPVYKVEKYLHQCVDSVIKQNLKSIEIILVNDGSPDTSPQICDDYKNKFDFIRVIHKPNGGLSSARNEGINAATGRYIMFMDSDDWWNPDVSMNNVMKTVRSHPETEMFLLTSLDYIEGEGFYKRKEHERLAAVRTDAVENYYTDLIANGNLEVSADTKIIKKDFLLNNQLYFVNGIVSEDSEWIIRLLRVLNKVSIIAVPLYCCRLGRSGSITNSIGSKNIVDMLNIVASSIKYCSAHAEFNERIKCELCYDAYLWFCALGLCAKLPKLDRKELKPLFLQTKSVCQYSQSKKTKLANSCLQFLGYDLTFLVLGIYISLKGNHQLNKKKVDIIQ